MRVRALDSEVASHRSGAGGVPALVTDVLRSPGRPLDACVRRDMEPSFGFDFSHVRVHTDERAADSAASISARAFTFGDHIVLGRRVGSLTSPAGRSTLAHELAHVAMAGDREPAPAEPVRVGTAGGAEERAAEAWSDAVLRGGTATTSRASARASAAEAGVIRRQIEPDDTLPARTGSWSTAAVSVNLTPPNVPRDPDQRSGREPVWCQFGGLDRGEECKPLQACRTTANSTFVVNVIYRVDAPPPGPAYPTQYHAQPIQVGGDFHFEPASGGERDVGSFQKDVRYAGHGRPVHTQRVTFSTPEAGLLAFSLRVGTPVQVLIFNGSAECKLVDCV